jgi:hypothetical protein
VKRLLRKHSLYVFSVNAIVSVLFEIVICKTMPETHFRSMEASQNKSNVTNQAGDLSVHVFSNSDRFEVIRDFRSLHQGGISFPVDGSIEHRH